MAGTLCNFATQLKFFAGYDDSLDVSDPDLSCPFEGCEGLMSDSSNGFFCCFFIYRFSLLTLLVV
jgi:hypothetical protein